MDRLAFNRLALECWAHHVVQFKSAFRRLGGKRRAAQIYIPRPLAKHGGVIRHLELCGRDTVAEYVNFKYCIHAAKDLVRAPARHRLAKSHDGGTCQAMSGTTEPYRGVSKVLC